VEIYPWILQQRGIDVQPIVTAPTPLRNKCEFTFGYQYLWPSSMNDLSAQVCMENPDAHLDIEDRAERSNGTTSITSAEPKSTKVPAVGFMVTGWSGGVSFSNSLRNIPSEITAIVDITNIFLLSSQLAPYDCTNHCGFWRILTVRVSRRTQECMVVVQHNSPTSANAAYNRDSVDGMPKEGFSQSNVISIFAAEREKLIAMLTDAELPSVSAQSFIKVTSIFFQEFSGLSNPSPEHPVQVSFALVYACSRHQKLIFCAMCSMLMGKSVLKSS
jgi:tRNA (uracil-5-)-methyltransferase